MTANNNNNQQKELNYNSKQSTYTNT